MSDPSDLDQLNARVAAMRAVLVQLLQDVVRAEQQLDSSQASQLLEANERLVVSALGAQTEAETAAGALDEAARSSGLDPLTGLPNRVLLLDRLGQAISNAKRHGHRVAVLFLDLDNFKEINDSFGHAVGDRALQMAATSMAAVVRATDTVSRHGGDEFLIVLGEIAHAVDASLIAEKLNVALREHGRIDDHRIRLSASIGISVYPEDGEDAQTLIDRADAAMYWAKKELLGGFAFHADRSPDQPGSHAHSVPSTLWRPTMTAHELTVVEHERRHAQLREANEQLVLAALGAQELQWAAEEARRRRTALLDAVAQELSNPYAPIRIAAAVLGRPQAHDELLSRAQEIIAQQMDQMSRRMAGLLEPETRVVGPTDTGALFDLCALATEVVQRCQPAIDTHLLTIEVHVSPTPIELRGSSGQIAQVLSTLVNNATVYSRPGGRILLSIERVGEAAVLTVTDNGAGIAPDALVTLLDPFVRDPRAGASSEDGLGLTVVRAIVEAHGGSVVAASAGLGQGSQFTVSLPTAVS